jgi:hypothetical protein
LTLRYEIVASNGDRAEAETEAAALLAVRTLRRDATDIAGPTNLVPPTVHVLRDGNHVRTYAPNAKP